MGQQPLATGEECSLDGVVSEEVDDLPLIAGNLVGLLAKVEG
jgi:hypothetical protein